MEQTVHPFNFEECVIPQESVEQMLGIETDYRNHISRDFFETRLGFKSSPEKEMDLDQEVTKESIFTSTIKKWEEENVLCPGPTSRKASSKIASITFTDLIRGSHLSTDSFTSETDKSPDIIETDTTVPGDGERKVTDKWGFVVEDPTSVANNQPKGSSRSQNKLEEKWLDILRDWSSYSEEKKKRICKKRIRKGIPNRVRGEMWKAVLDVADIRLENRDLFQRLLDEKSEFENQIYIDIHRTLPRHIFFQEQGGMGQTSLYNSLKAYSVYDKTVGYCQGMGFLMAMFLLYMTEEDAFFMLAQVISKHDIGGLYEPGFPALIQCFYVHDQLLHSQLPRLAAHFDEQMVAASMYATQWYPTLFSIALPFEFTIRIWDLFMVDGFVVMYRAAIAILRLMQKDLIKVEFEVIMDRLRNLRTYITITPDEFINVMMDSNITNKRLSKLAKEFTTGQSGGNWQ